MGAFHTRTVSLLACLALLACSEKSPGNPEPLPRDGGTGCDSSPCPDGGQEDAATPGADSSMDEDGGQEAGGQPVVDVDRCPPEAVVQDGCVELPNMNEATAGLCDGLDNDCNGVVDDSCPCAPGTVQNCFMGPPGRAGVGACRPGTQACISIAEFAGWGPCEGGQLPATETCDALDNDCNGCTDEIEGCEPQIDCPGPGDPRIPVGKPFTRYSLDAHEFYTGGGAAEYRWIVGGSGCDAMFLDIPGSAAHPGNGQLSYTVENYNPGRGMALGQQLGVTFGLSGEYPVTLEVAQQDGQVLSCTFPITVGASGLRVELCWEETGPKPRGGQRVDLDLRLGLEGQTTDWSGATDCNLESCIPNGSVNQPLWGHGDSALSNCLTGGDLDQVWPILDRCWNPRIDRDNREEKASYQAENINLDTPRNNETFRVAVQHRSGSAVLAHPLVNVYCGGSLRGAFGGPAAPLESFGTDGLTTELWRVADVTVLADGSCEISPLLPPGQDAGYWITDDDMSY